MATVENAASTESVRVDEGVPLARLGPTHAEVVYDQRQRAMEVRAVVAKLAKMTLEEAHRLKPYTVDADRLHTVKTLARAAQCLASASYDMDATPPNYVDSVE